MLGERLRVFAMKIRTGKVRVVIITNIYFALTTFQELCTLFHTSVHNDSMGQRLFNVSIYQMKKVSQKYSK